MCANCQEPHPSSSKDCIYYLIEEDTLTIQTRNKLPYFEAKRRAQAAALGSVRSTSSYSSVLQGRPKNNNTIARPQSEKPRMNRSDMRNVRQTIIRDDTIPQQSQEIITQTNLELVTPVLSSPQLDNDEEEIEEIEIDIPNNNSGNNIEANTKEPMVTPHTVEVKPKQILEKRSDSHTRSKRSLSRDKLSDDDRRGKRTCQSDSPPSGSSTNKAPLQPPHSPALTSTHKREDTKDTRVEGKKEGRSRTDSRSSSSSHTNARGSGSRPGSPKNVPKPTFKDIGSGARARAPGNPKHKPRKPSNIPQPKKGDHILTQTSGKDYGTSKNGNRFAGLKDQANGVVDERRLKQLDDI